MNLKITHFRKLFRIDLIPSGAVSITSLRSPVAVLSSRSYICSYTVCAAASTSISNSAFCFVLPSVASVAVMSAVHEDLLRIVADVLCRGARAVAAVAHTRGPKAYPCGIVLASLGVLRDAFILSSVSSSPSSSSLARWRLAHGGYDEFVLWVEALARSLIQTRADRRMGLSDNTSWLHEVEPAQVYLGLWQMKRYVALPLSVPMKLRRVLLFTCRAPISSSGSSIRAVGTSGGDIAADDDRLRMTDVDFAEVSSLDAVDLRVWQLLLLLGGQQSSVAVESGLSADDARGVTFSVSGRAPKRKHGGIDADVGQDSAPLLPGALLYHGVFAGGN